MFFFDTFDERILIMNKLTYSLILAALAGLSTVSAIAADAPAAPTPEHTLTGNVGLFSQYIYRGLTQTNEKAALQGGFDYAHSSGLYAGVWGSNISWIGDLVPGSSSSLELDTYFGYKNSFAEDFSYDVGFLRYNYPGSFPASMTTKADTNELYGQLGYKWFTAKYSHSISDTFGTPNSKNTNYLDLSANFEVADKLTLGLHVGKQTFKGDNAGVSNDSLYTYTDYKASLTKDINGYMVGAAYFHTNAKDAGYFNAATNKNVGRDHFVVSVSKSF